MYVLLTKYVLTATAIQKDIYPSSEKLIKHISCGLQRKKSLPESYQQPPDTRSLAPGPNVWKVSAVITLCSACQTQGLLTASPPSSSNPCTDIRCVVIV